MPMKLTDSGGMGSSRISALGLIYAALDFIATFTGFNSELQYNAKGRDGYNAIKGTLPECPITKRPLSNAYRVAKIGGKAVRISSTVSDLLVKFFRESADKQGNIDMTKFKSAVNGAVQAEQAKKKAA